MLFINLCYVLLCFRERWRNLEFSIKTERLELLYYFGALNFSHFCLLN